MEHQTSKKHGAILPTVSVVLCTFNSASYIEKCLKSILDSDFPTAKLEMICVDDGSSDNTLEVLSKYPITTIASSDRGGSARARNLGIERASGDIVLFVDSDSEVDPQMLHCHAVRYQNPRCCCVAGKTVQTGQSNLMSRCWETMPWIRIQRLDKDMIEKGLLWAPSGNLSARTSFAKEVLFDEKMKGHGEDVDLGWAMAKRGYQISREDKAIVYHKRKTSLGQLVPNMFSRGKSEINLGIKHATRTTNVFPSLVAVSTFLLALTLVLSVFYRQFLFVSPIFLLVYLGTDLVTYLTGHRTFGYYGYVGSSLRDKLAAWPVFLLLRMSYETGKIYEVAKTGRLRLLVKRVRYTEQNPQSKKVTVHALILMFSLILSLLLVWLLYRLLTIGAR